MTYLQAFIIAVIEGLTEFLPVSSTGHMILADSLLKVKDPEFTKTFEIVIQLGAIFSVVLLYRKRFLKSFGIYLKLFVAFIPTGIIGVLAYKTIKMYLFNPLTVSISLIVGGLVLIGLDRWSKKEEQMYADLEELGYLAAFKIGLIQCLSMVPGVSRAAATIFGGIYTGFNREQAAEFSFLLAVPTMMAAAGYDLLKEKDNIHSDDLSILLFGGLVAFIVAFLAIKAFIAFLNKYGFKYFGYYRILLGIAFLLFAYASGLELQP
ncbi:MAG: undecaprenyl-diphosphate phosphatase [Bacteroidia bacterium]|jgi:undecaprenyl-diphosphatase|nr:undecaprenyl-diphosphate phosphatase [Bacteroidia bacterium]